MHATIDIAPPSDDLLDVYHRWGFVVLEAGWLGGEPVWVTITGDDEDSFSFPLIVTDTGRALHAVSPYGYGGPPAQFYSSRSTSAVRAMAAEAGWASIYLRCHPIIGRVPDDFKAPGCLLTQVGDLAMVDLAEASDASLLESYSKNLRRDIVRARREGITAKIAPLSDGTAEFAGLYATSMERLDARPSLRYDEPYFAGLADAFGTSAFLSQTFVDDELVSVCCMTSQGTLSNYHLSASDYSSKLGGFAMKLALHEGLVECARRGAGVANLGGGVSGQADSLFAFKRRFASHISTCQAFRMVGDEALFAAAYGVVGDDALSHSPFPPVS